MNDIKREEGVSYLINDQLQSPSSASAIVEQILLAKFANDVRMGAILSPNPNDMANSQQILNLDSHCRDSFAEQKAKLKQLAETTDKHEIKLDSLLKDTAALKALSNEHLAKREDLHVLEKNLTDVLNSKTSGLDSKIDSNFKWIMTTFIGVITVICGALYGLTSLTISKTEETLKAGLDSNKSEIVEVRQEMKENYESLSKQLAEMRSLLQERQSTAKNN